LKASIRNEMNNEWALEKEKILNALAGSAEPTSLMDIQDSELRVSVQSHLCNSIDYDLRSASAQF